MAPVRSNDQEESSDSEQNACDGRPVEVLRRSEGSSGSKPDPGDQDQQDRDLGRVPAHLMRKLRSSVLSVPQTGFPAKQKLGSEPPSERLR